MLESGEDTKKVKDPTSDLVSEQDVGVSILSRGVTLSVSWQVLTVTAARKKHSLCCSVLDEPRKLIEISFSISYTLSTSNSFQSLLSMLRKQDFQIWLGLSYSTLSIECYIQILSEVSKLPGCANGLNIL